MRRWRMRNTNIGRRMTARKVLGCKEKDDYKEGDG